MICTSFRPRFLFFNCLLKCMFCGQKSGSFLIYFLAGVVNQETWYHHNKRKDSSNLDTNTCTWLLYSLWIGKNKRAKSSITKIIFFSLDFKCKNTCNGIMSFPVNKPMTHWPVNSVFWVSAVQSNLNVYHFISVSGTISCTC